MRPNILQSKTESDIINLSCKTRKMLNVRIKRFRGSCGPTENVIHNIPLSTSCTFSAMTGAEVYLKYENQQKTGSFKVRGAYNKIMKRFAEGDLHAVVASSAGNHA